MRPASISPTDTYYNKIMAEPKELIGLYLHLARAAEKRQKHLERDKLLVLGGACASEMGLEQVAGYCRHKILQNNPGHLLRKYDSFADALGQEEFESYLNSLFRHYPLEKAEYMLESLGIDRSNEREAYFDDLEYAASLLGLSADELAQYDPAHVCEVGEEAPSTGGSILGDDTSDGEPFDLASVLRSGDDEEEDPNLPLSTEPPPPAAPEIFRKQKPVPKGQIPRLLDDGSHVEETTPSSMSISLNDVAQLTAAGDLPAFKQAALLHQAETEEHKQREESDEAEAVANAPLAEPPAPTTPPAAVPPPQAGMPQQPSAAASSDPSLPEAAHAEEVQLPSSEVSQVALVAVTIALAIGVFVFALLVLSLAS